MRLAELVARFPTVHLATAAENERILEFFERAPMHTPAFAVQYRRRPDFFRLLGYQAERTHVLFSEDRSGRVRGVATLSLRPGWVSGRPATIGYLGDLRVRTDRAIVAIWRSVHAELLARAREIEELSDCAYWFSAILDNNLPARLAVGRPREGLPSYVPLAPFVMRNLIARLPTTRRARLTRWQTHDAAAGDRLRLSEFFEAENRRLPFGFFRGEFERRLDRWDGLSVSDFVYATEGDEIVACMAPWSPSRAKQTVVSSVPMALRLLGRAAALLPRAPLRIPEAGEDVRTPYLTHLTFASRLAASERAGVLRDMLNRLFDRWRDVDWHGVALCDFTAWGLGRALGGFLQYTVPITVYAVVPPGAPVSAVEALRRAGPPAFEMAMV